MGVEGGEGKETVAMEALPCSSRQPKERFSGKLEAHADTETKTFYLFMFMNIKLILIVIKL